MLYIYETTVYTNTDNVIGVNPAAEAANKTDFETNYKASTIKIDELAVAETSARIIKTYAQFKNLISGDITWGDVKRFDDTNHYELYLITNVPL